MLRMTPSSHANAAKKYFGENLTRSDYYFDGQEVAGHWGGKLGERLGLSGEVDQKSYYALCDNLDPQSGGQLTPRMKGNRTVGYDFTFSAPKAVSVLYELTGNEAIREAFQSSYRETMTQIEQGIHTRVRKGGKDEDRVTGNMVWAEFQHFTARPVNGVPDPHLHSHCFVFNTTWDEQEQRFKAGQFRPTKRDADYYEAAFHARFAKRLNALGIATVKDGTSFTLAGVERSLTDKFSQRRDLIEKRAKELGVSSAEGKHAIGYYGREHKNAEIAKSQLRQIWRERLSDEEKASIEKAAKGEYPAAPEYSANDAKDYAIGHAFERASTISDKRLMAEALRYGVGSVLPEDVADITRHGEIIAEARDGQTMTTTKGVLRDEIAMLQIALDGQRRFAPLIRPEQLPKGAFDSLSPEQRKAALLLVSSRDQVTGVLGKAGTGKTHTIRAAVDAIHSMTDRKVFSFAPSSQASRGVLAKEGFKNATTLETLLRNEKLQKEVAGHIILVDEAGLISSRDMKRLMDIAKKGNSRVFLAGDYTQHASVEAGDAFRLMEEQAGVRMARLTEVRRQTEPGYRKAVEAIAVGSGKAAQKGFDALNAMGNIIEANAEERHSMLVSDYLKAAEEGRSALIVAPTHSEGGRITQAVRDRLKENGAIGREREFKIRKSTGWTKAEKGDGRNFEPGMIVEFNQNTRGFTKGDKTVVMNNKDGVLLQKQDGSQVLLPMSNTDRFEVYRSNAIGIGKGDRIRITRNGEGVVEGQTKATRFNNGDIYTVEGFDKQGNIRLGQGKMLPADYGHFNYGVVDTSYASQGKTVDRVFIAVGNESLPATNQQQWYVSATRGREQAKIYVDSKLDVREAIAKPGQRLSAMELTGTKLKRSWAASFRSIFERLRVRRFFETLPHVEPHKERKGYDYGRA